MNDLFEIVLIHGGLRFTSPPLTRETISSEICGSIAPCDLQIYRFGDMLIGGEPIFLCGSGNEVRLEDTELWVEKPKLEFAAIQPGSIQVRFLEPVQFSDHYANSRQPTISEEISRLERQDWQDVKLQSVSELLKDSIEEHRSFDSYDSDGLSLINNETNFLALGFDELDGIELVMDMEDELEISVKDEEIEECKTVGQAVALFQKLLLAKHEADSLPETEYPDRAATLISPVLNHSFVRIGGPQSNLIGSLISKPFRMRDGEVYVDVEFPHRKQGNSIPLGGQKMFELPNCDGTEMYATWETCPVKQLSAASETEWLNSW